MSKFIRFSVPVECPTCEEKTEMTLTTTNEGRDPEKRRLSLKDVLCPNGHKFDLNWKPEDETWEH